MEELSNLVKLVKDLPQLALWVAIGFWAYKVIIVGSIYGVIRYVSSKLFDYLSQKKAREIEYKEFRPMLDGMCIKAETDRLIAQLNRIRGRGLNIESEYIHSQSIEWLRQAIDDKIEKEILIKNKS